MLELGCCIRRGLELVPTADDDAEEVIGDADNERRNS